MTLVFLLVTRPLRSRCGTQYDGFSSDRTPRVSSRSARSLADGDAGRVEQRCADLGAGLRPARRGTRDRVALRVGDAQAGEDGEILEYFDALGADACRSALGEAHEAFHERLLG